MCTVCLITIFALFAIIPVPFPTEAKNFGNREAKLNRNRAWVVVFKACIRHSDTPRGAKFKLQEVEIFFCTDSGTFYFNYNGRSHKIDVSILVGKIKDVCMIPLGNINTLITNGEAQFSTQIYLERSLMTSTRTIQTIEFRMFHLVGWKFHHLFTPFCKPTKRRVQLEHNSKKLYIWHAYMDMIC